MGRKSSLDKDKFFRQFFRQDDRNDDPEVSGNKVHLERLPGKWKGISYPLSVNCATNDLLSFGAQLFLIPALWIRFYHFRSADKEIQA